jgi:hypothetical protein
MVFLPEQQRRHTSCRPTPGIQTAGDKPPPFNRTPNSKAALKCRLQVIGFPLRPCAIIGKMKSIKGLGHLMRTLRACAFIIFALPLFSCGGHNKARVGGAGASPVNSEHPQSLSDALAQLDALPVPADVKPEVFLQLKAALKSALTTNNQLPTTRIVSTPPTGEANRVNDLAIADNGDGTYSLTWHYRNLGDYNQDGVVGVADITPLAVHYGETWTTGQENSIAAVVDGSGNNKVDIADVTPIAMNFACSVDHYTIEASDAVDSDFTLISESSLSATDNSSRLNFNYSIGEPPTFAYWRIAPVDESDGQGDYSNVSLEFRPGWHIQTVYDSGTVSYPSMAIVGGTPAISYIDSDSLKYVWASDPFGETWNMSVVDSGLSTGRYSSLHVVEEQPAISYFTMGYLKYVWAEDDNGESWNTPVNVISSLFFVSNTSLLVADSNPFIVYDYSNGDGFDLYCIRSTDIYGAGWNIPKPIDRDLGWASAGRFASATVVNGNPAISYYDNINYALLYIRATEPDGSSWGSPVTVDGEGRRESSLTVVNGYPAITYNNDNGLCYVRAADPNGDTWNTPVIIDGGGYVPNLAVVNNYPAISYVGGAADLMYVRAADENGENWGAPVTIDPWGDVGANSSLAVINGHPAISYMDSTNGNLKFAIYY